MTSPTTRDIAALIADRIFSNIYGRALGGKPATKGDVWEASLRQERDKVERLLIEFAEEIKRSAIEP